MGKGNINLLPTEIDGWAKKCFEHNVSRGVKRREVVFVICYSCFALYTNISVKASCVLCQLM